MQHASICLNNVVYRGKITSLFLLTILLSIHLRFTLALFATAVHWELMLSCFSIMTPNSYQSHCFPGYNPSHSVGMTFVQQIWAFVFIKSMVLILKSDPCRQVILWRGNSTDFCGTLPGPTGLSTSIQLQVQALHQEVLYQLFLLQMHDDKFIIQMTCFLLCCETYMMAKVVLIKICANLALIVVLVAL